LGRDNAFVVTDVLSLRTVMGSGVIAMGTGGLFLRGRSGHRGRSLGSKRPKRFPVLAYCCESDRKFLPLPKTGRSVCDGFGRHHVVRDVCRTLGTAWQASR